MHCKWNLLGSSWCHGCWNQPCRFCWWRCFQETCRKSKVNMSFFFPWILVEPFWVRLANVLGDCFFTSTNLGNSGHQERGVIKHTLPPHKMYYPQFSNICSYFARYAFACAVLPASFFPAPFVFETQPSKSQINLRWWDPDTELIKPSTTFLRLVNLTATPVTDVSAKFGVKTQVTCISAYVHLEIEYFWHESFTFYTEELKVSSI